MENETTRPSIGFPLGLALLLSILLCMSCFFSCFLNWDKLRSLLRSLRNQNPTLHTVIIAPLPHKPSSSSFKKEITQNQAQILPVLMPGDRVPKFIAMACPCEPPIINKVSIKVQKPPANFPVPLYL